ncbi:MAG: hypothetical protein J5I47_08800 [Vicingus serpentipes]|nr:hypothetical protein [Vicingus serpentipes]
MLKIKLFFLCSIVSCVCNAQLDGEKQKDVMNEDNLFLMGEVTEYFEGELLSGTVIKATSDGNVVAQGTSDSEGRFELVLHFDKQYTVTFSRAGFVSKKMTIDTRGVPDHKHYKCPDMDIEITLFKPMKCVDMGMMSKPIGRAIYFPKKNVIDFDMEYSGPILASINKMLNDCVEQLENEDDEEAKAQAEKEAALAEQKRLAEERAKEEAKRREEEAKAKAEKEDALAEQKRLAEERAKEEAKRKEEEAKAQAEKEAALAEQKRLAEEKAKKEAALAEQKRLAEEKAEEEAKKKVDEAKSEAEKEVALAEQKKIAEEIAKRKEEEEAKAKEIAEQKRLEEEAREKELKAVQTAELAEKKRQEKEAELAKQKQLAEEQADKEDKIKEEPKVVETTNPKRIVNSPSKPISKRKSIPTNNPSYFRENENAPRTMRDSRLVLKTVIGYTQAWDPIKKKWTKEPIFQDVEYSPH